MLVCGVFHSLLSAVGCCLVFIVIACCALIMLWRCLLSADDCVLAIVVACSVLLLFVVVCYVGVYDWLLLFVALLFWVFLADCWSLFVVCRVLMVFGGCLLYICDGCWLLVVVC